MRRITPVRFSGYEDWNIGADGLSAESRVISMTPNTSTNSNTELEQAGRSTAIIHTTGLFVLVLVSAY